MRTPFVTRRRLDRIVAALTNRAEHAERDLKVAIDRANVQSQRAIDLRLMLDGATTRLGAADERARQATEAANALMAEARKALSEATEMAKLAARTMFGAEVGEVAPPMSVGVADRAAAVRMREEEQARRLRPS